MGGKQRFRRQMKRLKKQGSVSGENTLRSIDGEATEGSVGVEETPTADSVDFEENSDDIHSLKMKIQTLEIELIQAEKALNDQRRETEDWQSKHHSLRTEQEKFKQENSQLKEESKKVRAVAKLDADTERLNNWIEKLGSENDEKQTSLDLLSDEHQRLKNERDLWQSAELDQKLLHVTSECDRLKKENLMLEEAAQDFKSLTESLKAQLTDATEEVKLVKAQIPSIKAASKNLEQEKHALEDTNEKIHQERQAVEMEKDTVCKCLEDAQIKFDTTVSELNKTLTGLKEEKNKLQESLREKEVELADLQRLSSGSWTKAFKARHLLKNLTWPHAAALSAGAVAAAAAFIKIRA